MILVTIFWNFAIFQYRSDSPQVKRNLTSSTSNLVYKLPHQLPNDLRLRKLGNIIKFTNLGGHIAQCPVSPHKNQILTIAVKKFAKIDTKLFFSCPVLLDFFTWFQIFRPRLQIIAVGRESQHPGPRIYLLISDLFQKKSNLISKGFLLTQRNKNYRFLYSTLNYSRQKT